MKKFSKRVLIIVLAVLFCITSNIQAFASIKEDKEWAPMYYYDVADEHGGYWAMVDINGDKVVDLLWIDTEDGYYKIYKYRNRKLKCLKKVCYARGGDLLYNKSKHTVVMTIGQFGGHEAYVYKVYSNSAKRIQKFSVEYDRSSGKNVTKYYVNNKRVTKANYNKKWKAAKKGCKKVKDSVN